MSFFYRAIRGPDFSTRSTAADGPKLLDVAECLSGRAAPPSGSPTSATKHFVTQRLILPPYPDNLQIATFAMGCFWCAESLFGRRKGVYITAVGYANGVTPHPTYEEICTGKTNHAEAVRVVFDPLELRYQDLLKDFWEKHDPTTYMRQGNDSGTQYRSAIYIHNDSQRVLAEESRQMFAAALAAKQITAPITTEIEVAKEFYFAEEYHQQFDAKPGSRQYCGLRPTGAVLPQDFCKRSS